ncbi:MAG: MATE family efflux transporter [Alphaproteobacteria bacterium]|nr:MATE family efflux transporter [Alphaproteobacteria bacterium]
MFHFNRIQLKSYIKEIAKLSLPIATSFLAMGIMGVVDTMIVGNYDTVQLAYIGLANSIFVILFTIPIGLLNGVMIKSSQKFGARKFQSCGKIYNEGKKYAFLLSAIFLGIGINGEAILRLLGQNPEMVKHGGEILRIFVFSIPFILIYINANFFLQSIRRPQIATYGILAANVINIIINPILVWGFFGCPAMGAVGSASTTLIVRILLAFYMLYYIHNMKKNPKLNKRFGLDRSYDTWWGDSKTTRQIGYGVAIMTIATNGSFSAVSNFAAWLGEQTMAVFVIMINISSLIVMLGFAISQATAIVVAGIFGKKNYKNILTATCAGYIIQLLIMCSLISIVYLFPKQICGLFTQDKIILSAVIGYINYLLWVLIIDVLPMNLSAALNGQGDIKIPTIFQIISFLIIRISCCYVLAFIFDLGLIGLIFGLMCGGIASFLLNGGRLIYLLQKYKKAG